MAIKKTSFAIIGAGISGLSFAFYLKKYRPETEFKIFEEKEISGGCIKKTEDGFDAGPHIFKYSRASFLLSLIEELHLSTSLLFSDENAHKRYYLSDSRLKAFPYSFKSFISSAFFPLSLYAVAKDLMAFKIQKDESIFDFCKRRFGKKLTLKLFDPIVTGIWAGNMYELSVLSCFKTMKEWEMKYGSVLLGFLKTKKEKKKKGLFTLRGGIVELPKALSHHLTDHIIYNSKVDQIEKNYEGYLIKTGNENYLAEKVIFALPLSETIRLFECLDSHISKLLSQIPLKGVKLVNLYFNKSIMIPQGFGYLTPTSEGSNVLGMIFDSKVFPQQEDTEWLTVMVKQEVQDPFEAAIQALKEHLKVKEMPTAYHVSDYSASIPQYVLGHEKIVQNIAQALSTKLVNLKMLGNFLDGVSVNDCIQRAKELAQSFSSSSMS